MYKIEIDIDGRPYIKHSESLSELEAYDKERKKERKGENKISYKILYYLGGIVLLIVYIFLSGATRGISCIGL